MSADRMTLVEQLREILLDPASPDSERKSASRALRRLADEEILGDLLERALLAGSTAVSEQVVALVAERRTLEPTLETRLIGFLYEEQPQVRRATLTLLRDRGSARMVAALERIVLEAQAEGSILTEEDAQLAQEARLRILERTA